MDQSHTSSAVAVYLYPVRIQLTHGGAVGLLKAQAQILIASPPLSSPSPKLALLHISLLLLVENSLGLHGRISHD